jgi:hypothetical protein
MFSGGFMQKFLAYVLFGVTFISFSQAGEIHCVQNKTASSTVVYTIDGQLNANLARVKIVARDEAGATKTDIDTRSNFVFTQTVGQYNVYTTGFVSNRTGITQSDLKLQINTVSNEDGTSQAIYSKQVATGTQSTSILVQVKLTCSIQ